MRPYTTEYKAAGVKRLHGRRRRAPSSASWVAGEEEWWVGMRGGGGVRTYKHGRVREPTQY